jgi:hypothetical protein
MAGNASRIFNFCHSHFNSAGCPFPKVVPKPPPKVCDDFPFKIGTAVGCSVYNVYWLRGEYVEADVTIPDWAGTPGAGGTTFNLVAPLYAGVYHSGITPAPIGYFKLITSQFKYDTSKSLLNTDNYSFYWINADAQLVATMDSIYDYIGTDTTPFFTPGSTHKFNSTRTCAYQLFNKTVAVELYAGVSQDDYVRQCKLTIRNA